MPARGRATHLVGLTVVAAIAAISGVSAQTAPKVDFRRDVQPILRDHCYACHGPEQQMNGLRLDRRADAMRGGSQSDIGPGNADGSRLYHRLIGKAFGQQMPPTGALSADQIAVVKAWIDQGAQWPDDLSGEKPSPPIDPDAERLVQLIRQDDRPAIDGLLRRTPQAARARVAGGSTALMYAAQYGDAGLMKKLIAAGAEPDASNTAGATALMWAVPDLDRMRVLLSAGVDVEARSEDRRTALLIASGIVGAEPAVRLLLEYGASPWVRTPSDLAPLREAARVDNADVFRVLLDYGADRSSAGSVAFLRTNCFQCANALELGGAGPLARVPPPDAGLRPTLLESTTPRHVGVTAASPAAIRDAVVRGLPLLQKVDVPFIQMTGCVSCHHNSLVAMAVNTARQNGYRVDERSAALSRDMIAKYLESWRERTLQNGFIAGADDTISYLMFGMAEAQHEPDPAAEAQARWLMHRQAEDGRWPVVTLRPPIESNDIAVTALSIRALQAFAPKARRGEYQKAVERARDWLASARGDSTEEKALRVLGLSWSSAPPDQLKSATKELLTAQRSDGGWSQLETMESDAYATGEAVTALMASGASPSDPAITRGVEFLLRTQFMDGSWFVKSRSVPIQAYFESGFPYGADQWISSAATAWSVTALASVTRSAR